MITKVVDVNVSGYIISNIASLNTFNLTFSNKSVNVTLNYVTPTSVGVTVDKNSSYALGVNETQLLPGSKNTYLKLLNISYIPIEQTITLYVYSASNTSTNATQKLNVSFSLSNFSSISVIPATLSNTVNITNVSSSTPAAPDGYLKISATQIEVNSTSFNSTGVSIGYFCGIPSQKIVPFELENSSWVQIKPFGLNSTTCSISFSLNSSISTVALMQIAPPATTTITIAPTTTIVNGTGTSLAKTPLPSSKGELDDLIYILIAVAISGIAIGVIYDYTKRYGHHIHVSLATRRHIFTIAFIALIGTISLGVYSYSVVHHGTIAPPLFNRTYSQSTPVLHTRGQSFQELGLPAGTRWSVQLGTSSTNGAMQSGVANSQIDGNTLIAGYINFTVPFGNYYYTVGQVPGYNLVGYKMVNQGYLNLSPYNAQSSIQGLFVKCTSSCNSSNQTLSFEQLGLAPGARWSVTVDGAYTVSSNLTYISLEEPLGTHSYTINPADGYNSYPGSGSVNLTRGSSQYTVAVDFGR